jgi:Carboxypeptidase regulatory-like domain
MPGSKASAALLQTVADAALRIMEDGDCYVATSPSSTPILAEHIATLADPASFASSPGALAAAVQLSRIVDFVQDGSPVFDWQRVGQPFVSDVYRSILPNIRFAKAALDGEELREFEQAQATLYTDPPFERTPAYDQYAQLKTQVALGLAQLQLCQRDLTAADEAARAALRERIAAIEEGLAVQQPLLKALDDQHGFEEALRIYHSAQLVDVPRSFADASALLDTKLLDITTADGTETHVRAVFSPGRLAEENWITVKIGRADISAAAADNPLVPPAPSGDQVATLDEDAIERIELDLQVFKVERFWMWEALFSNRMWKWETPDDPVSTGERPPQGKLPAYTAAVIVARNLRISGRKPLLDSAVVGSAATLQVGTFRFAMPTVDAAGQTLRIAARGWLVPGTAGGSTASRALLARLPNYVRPVMTGRVADAREHPLADATVQATDLGGGQIMVKTTAQNGEVSFELAGPATYEVTVTKPGYRTSTQQVAFAPGGQFTVKLESEVQVPTVLVARQRFDPGSPFLRGLPVRWPRPAVPQPPAAHPLTVALARVVADDRLEPMDVPVRIEVSDAQGVSQQVVTVDPGKDIAFSLDPGRYQVSAHCEVYDPAGPSVQTVELSQPAGVTFSYRPRTILESNELYLVGFVCRRVPRSPSANPDARW